MNLHIMTNVWCSPVQMKPLKRVLSPHAVSQWRTTGTARVMTSTMTQ